MLKTSLILIALSLFNIGMPQASPTLNKEDQAALKLGQQVLALNYALQNPQQEKSLQAVTELGNDQHYYIMVRGWLAYQLQADISIANAAQKQTSEQIKTRIDFLKKAIRAVDLE